ncbi:MAG: general secretion pathway protein GspB [Planctomycetes bacterium]|nr:general secretion pathway protein GspB [Planctomycetota bacterium]
MRYAVVAGMLCAVAAGVWSSEAGGKDRYPPIDTNRRDPFTLLTLGNIPPPPPPPHPEILDEKLMRAARSAAEQAELAFRNDDQARAMALCAATLKDLAKMPHPKLFRDYQRLCQRLRALHDASARLIEHRAAERDFAALRLSLTGTVARSRKSFALIGGKVLQPGDTFRTHNGGDPLTVEEVRDRLVILRFRGVQVQLAMVK